MKMYVIRCGCTWRDGFEMRNADEPSIGAHDVLVKVRAVALNFRDLRKASAERDTVPLSDAAGEVLSVGAAVSTLKVGERVAANFFPDWTHGRFRLNYHGNALGGTADGMLTEYKALPERSWVKVPEHLSFEQAATLPTSALTAWHATNEVGPVRSGDTVLIIGTGGVAVFALQFAKLAGARVIVVSSSEEKYAKLSAMGAEVINSVTNRDWPPTALKMTAGEGVDQLIELGGGGTLARSFAATRAGGDLKLIGALTGHGLTVDPLPIILRSLTVNGLFVGSCTMFERMNRAIAVNGLCPIIERIFELAEIREAYELQESGKQLGKIVVRLS